jgi:hypothetical protein
MRKILKVYENIRNSSLPDKEKSIIIKQIKNEYRQSIKHLANKEFWAFCEYCMKDESNGEYIELQDFHIEWCKLIQDTKRLVLFSCIDSGKSSICSVAYPIFLLGTNSSHRGAIVSNVATAASKFLSSIKEYIMRDEDVKEIFPDLKPMKDQVNANRNEKWTDSAIIVNRPFISKDFSIQALGQQGPLLCSRIDFLILDDVLDKKNTDSETTCRKICEWHDSIAKGRLVNDAQEIIIGTAWNSCYSNPNQYILTPSGNKIVSSISIGDDVFDYNWDKTKVIGTYKSYYSGITYVIQVDSYNEPIKCTPQHRFLTQHGWVEAQYLTSEHYFPIKLSTSSLLDNANVVNVPIKDITTEYYEGYIYDIETEAKGYYISDCYVHNSDLMHYLSEKEGYTAYRYSMEQEDVEAGTHRLVYWPRRHSRKKLDEERRHNPDEYNRQRRSRVASPDNQEFHDYIEKYLDPMVSVGDNWIKCTGIDLSSSRRPGDAICDIAVSPDLQKRVVIDIEYGQWKADVRAKHIGAHHEAHRPRIISIEDNSLQRDNLEWMAVSGYKNLPIKGFTTTGANKDSLIMNNAIELRNGLWWFKNSHNFDEVCKCDWCRFIREIKNYPDYKTSDGFMAWLLASEAARGLIGKEPRIRLIDISSTIEEDNLLKAKPVFTLEDYRIENRLTSPDFIAPPDYVGIVREVQRLSRNSSNGNIDNIEGLNFELDDITYVLAEMNKVVARLNGEVVR